MRMYEIVYSEVDNVPLNSTIWDRANIAMIDNFPWDREGARPRTLVRLIDSPGGISIRFEVCEQPILARYKNPNDPVCRDSCVEFFMQPDAQDDRYMNFELNPLGTMLLGIGTGIDDLKFLDNDRDLFSVETNIENTSWTLKLFIPYSFLLEFFKGISNPFRANLQKCTDHSPETHYGCWSPIGTPNPDFHRPEYFGLFTRVKSSGGMILS